MKIIKHILLFIIAISLASCSLFTKQPAVLTAADTLAISNAIRSHYDNAQNIYISEVYVGYITLCWNDPAGKDPQTITVKSNCWKITFDHRVYNSDSVYLYTDYYKLYMPKNDSLAFLENRFHGSQYHGNTCVMIKGSSDPRYPNTPFVRPKDNYIRLLESILNKP